MFCVGADPDAGLVRPGELVLVDAALETLLEGIPGAEVKEMNKKISLCIVFPSHCGLKDKQVSMWEDSSEENETKENQSS